MKTILDDTIRVNMISEESMLDFNLIRFVAKNRLHEQQLIVEHQNKYSTKKTVRDYFLNNLN
jgi:hypothetical protein